MVRLADSMVRLYLVQEAYLARLGQVAGTSEMVMAEVAIAAVARLELAAITKVGTVARSCKLNMMRHTHHRRIACSGPADPIQSRRTEGRFAGWRLSPNIIPPPCQC